MRLIRDYLNFLRSHTCQQNWNAMKYVISNRSGIFKNANLIYSPLYITAVLTYRCNIRCSFCGVFKHDPITDKEYQDMPFSLYQKILQKFRSALTIRLGGGEPFLHKDIFKMIEYARKFKMRVAIDTNGTLIPNMIDQILSAAPHLLSVSLNACNEEEYRKINNAKKGVFEEVLNGIGKLIEEKNKKRRNIKLAVSYVCTKRNYAEIPRMVELGQELGVERIYLRNLLPIPKYGFTQDHCLYEDDADVREVINNFDRTKHYTEVIGPYLLKKIFSIKYLHCIQPFVWMTVIPNGDVLTCCTVLPYYSLFSDGESARHVSKYYSSYDGSLYLMRTGNIYDQNVWNSDLFQKMRLLMIDSEPSSLPTFCKICSNSTYSHHLPPISSFKY